MKYSEKIQSLLENSSINLKILLEEDEDDSKEEKEEKSIDSKSLDDMFGSLDDDSKEEPDDENLEDTDDNNELEDTDGLNKDNYEELTSQIDNATEKMSSTSVWDILLCLRKSLACSILALSKNLS